MASTQILHTFDVFLHNPEEDNSALEELLLQRNGDGDDGSSQDNPPFDPRVLSLFQFPTWQSNPPKENATKSFERIDVKPGHTAEIDVSLDLGSSDYDSSKARAMAQRLNSASSAKSLADPFPFPQGMMTEQHYRAELHSASDRLYAGFVSKDQKSIHLVKLSQIAQFFPSFKHYDALVPAQASTKTKQEIQDAGDSSQDEATSSTKPIEVRYVRADASKSALLNPRVAAAWDTKAKLRADIPNRTYTVESSSEAIQSVLDRYVGERQESTISTSHIHLEPRVAYFEPGYTERLFGDSNAQTASSTLSSNVPPTGALLDSLPLVDRIRVIMKSAHVVQFDQIVQRVLPKSHKDMTGPQRKGSKASALNESSQHVKDVLSALTECATLVGGCWVVKSDEIYPEKSHSSGLKNARHCPIPASIMRDARDLILYRFRHAERLVRADIAPFLRLPSDDVAQILSAISTPKTGKGWIFHASRDDDKFAERFPDVARAQANAWENRFNELKTSLNLTKDFEKKIRASDSSLSNAGPEFTHNPEAIPTHKRSPKRRRASGPTVPQVLVPPASEDQFKIKDEPF